MMKILKFALLLAVALCLSDLVRANTIALWNFETTTPANSSGTSASYGIADSGEQTTGSSASGYHAGSATWTFANAGNGSPHSFSVNTWVTGDYWQFHVSTIGFEGIVVSWDQTSSSTGPGEFKLAYQINGAGFFDFQNYTVLPNQSSSPGLGAWSSGASITGYGFSVDLSSVTGLNNATSVDFRLIMRTTADSTPPGTVATGGTDRVDNFAVMGSPITRSVPDTLPASFGILAILGVVAVVEIERIRRVKAQRFCPGKFRR